MPSTNLSLEDEILGSGHVALELFLPRKQVRRLWPGLRGQVLPFGLKRAELSKCFR